MKQILKIAASLPLLASLIWCINGQNCLVHRVDSLPCDFRLPDITNMPESNEWGLYSTRITSGPSCDIRRRNHKVDIIQTINGDPRVKFLFSPGIELSPQVDYGNQLIEIYNVSCPPNHDAYFNITEINMEPANCPDPNEEVDKCVDYVRVEHGSFGATESCGMDPGQNREILTQGNLVIIFRTDDNGRFPGFKSFVTCIERGQVNTPTDDDNRRKRSTGVALSLEQEIENNIQYVRRLTTYYSRRGYLTRYRRWYPWLFRVETVSIQFGQNFTYRFKRLQTQQGADSVRFDRIFTLKVRSPDGVKVFRKSARNEFRELIRFSGPGTLTIVGCYAFFSQYIVSPVGILPLTEDERSVIFQLTTAHYDRIDLERPEDRLCREVLSPPEIDFNNLPTGDPEDDDLTLPECPRVNVSTPSTCDFTDDQLRLALANVNSRSVIVRILVDVVVECTRSVQPGRIERLNGSSDALTVNCDISPSVSGIFAVRCSSNREGGVFVQGCTAIAAQSQQTVALDEFCSFPTFTFPTTEVGIRPGEQLLTMNFVDELEFTATVDVRFFVSLSVNCSVRFGLNPIVNVTCASNQIASELTISSCTVDGEIPLRQCVFPNFVVDAGQLSPGQHELNLEFSDRTFTLQLPPLRFTVFGQI